MTAPEDWHLDARRAARVVIQTDRDPASARTDPRRKGMAMLGGLGPMELVIVLVIALLVLGPKRLPDAGRAVGRGLREFKGALTGGDDDEPAERKV
jgi:sec-independent protein translocase protein TatA